MATLESLAIRSDAACERIENKVIEDWGVKSAPLPRLNRNRDELRANQLERIADMLEAVERFQEQALDPRLVAALDLVQSGNWTKAEMEAVLLGEPDGTE